MIDDEKSFDLSGGLNKDEGGDKADDNAEEVASESSVLLEVIKGNGESDEVPVESVATGDIDDGESVDDVVDGTALSTDGFSFILKQTFSVFFKKIWVFLGLAVLNIGVIGVLAVFVMPDLMISLMSAGIWVMFGVMILLGLLQAVLSFVFYGAIANQAHSTYNDLSISVMDSVKTAFKLVGRGIYLGFRILIYSWVWLIIVAMILSAVLTTVVGGGGGYMGFENGVVETAYAVDSNLIAQGGGLLGEADTGRLVGEAPTGMRPVLLSIISLVLGLFVFVVSIVAMIRIVRASMAFPILFANPEASAREALDESKRITKDHWWLIVCFVLIFTFLLVVIPVLFQLLPLLLGNNAVLNIVLMVVSLAAALLSFPLITTFYQILAEELGNTARRLNLHVGLLVVAILIFLSPTLIALAAPTIIGNMLGGSSIDTFGESGATTFGESDFSYFDEMSNEGGDEDGLTGFSFGDEDDEKAFDDAGNSEDILNDDKKLDGAKNDEVVLSDESETDGNESLEDISEDETGKVPRGVPRS